MEDNPIFCLFASFMWLVGVIGGFGFLCYDGHYMFAAAEFAVALMSWPKAQQYFNRLWNQ